MTGRQALAKMYGEGAMVGHAELGRAIKVANGKVVDQDGEEITRSLWIWLVTGLDRLGWFEVEKPKVVANGLAELFAKDDGKMNTWVGENGTWYFIDRLGYLRFVNHPNSSFPVDQLFLHQKFTPVEKEEKS